MTLFLEQMGSKPLNCYTLTERAILIALSAHEGQKDKAGVDYIMHPLTVSVNPLLKTEEERVVAILHDVVEDSGISLMDLENYFPKSIIDTLELLTHLNTDSYDTYINNIANSNNLTAIKVKLSDLEHNMDLSRIPNSKLTEKDKTRLRKYANARNKLLAKLPTEITR